MSDDAAAKRLRLAREQSGYKTARAAADAFGWNYTSYKAHESALRGLKKETAQVYARAFKVGVSWIIVGDNAPSWDIPLNVAKRSAPIRSIPRLAWTRVVAMSVGVMPTDLGVTGIVTVDGGDDVGKRAFALDIEAGDLSMVGRSGGLNFEPGETLIFDPDQIDIDPGDYVLAHVAGDERAVFRRYRPRGKSTRGALVFELVPLNDDYETIRIGEGVKGKILGRLVRKIMKF